MFQNYLKLTLRSLLKHPQFSLLNILGLSLGLSVSLLLFIHVRNERTFDVYHSKAERIYRVILNASFGEGPVEQLANAPNAIGPSAAENIGAVKGYARLLKHEFGGSAFIKTGEKKLVEEHLYWADPGLTDIFDIPVMAGDLKSALTQPNSLALSQSAAKRYFGDADPLGKLVQIDRMPPLEVRAVYADFPGHSYLNAAILGSFSTMKWANDQLIWSNASFETWLLLSDPDAHKNAEVQLTQLFEKNVPEDNRWYSLWLQPLLDVHLHSSQMRNNYSDRLGDPKQVGIFGILALTVLTIACFNYMNLSTARAQLRFKDVGINKTMGATRGQLTSRFYLETVTTVAISLLFAIGLLALGIPAFNHLAEKQLGIQSLFTVEGLLILGGAGALTAILAGSYPALFLSAFQPKQLLQTSFRPSSGSGLLRRGLVTAQFAASVTLLVATAVLYGQMKYIQQKNLGFEPSQVVAINTSAAESKDQIDALLEGCRELSSVQAVCRAQTYPGGTPSGRVIRKKEDDREGLSLSTCVATPGFESVLNLKFLAGSTLPKKSPDDTLVHVVLNKTAVDFLGLSPEEAVGKKVNCDLNGETYVAGVVDDFHAESLHKPIGAYAFHDAKTEPRRFTLVKTNTSNLPETMRQIEAVFNKALPHSAFEATFLDEHIAWLYRSEQKASKVIAVFSLLSVLVSCLGLFGLAAFAAEQRAKEIGIRKVLGASVAGITGLLAKDFLKLVLVAILIASPIAYYSMQNWLSDFAYRIEIQWWMFAAAGLTAVAIAFLTVSFQSIKAALDNPVKSLRSE